MAEGSGFIYDNQGHIVTNNHVVADATEIKVTLHILRDGKEMQLDVVLGLRPSAQQQQADSGSAQLLTAGKAISAAKQAVQDAGLMSSVDSTSAHHGMANGQPAWIVKLTGEGKTATVTIYAQTGDVIDLAVQK